MARKYTLKRRAESKADTRRRIVEAMIELHGLVGPARTTVSMIAERAGVQRHTFYAHFPDERSMLMACSGHVMEADPMPEAEPWRALAEPVERLTMGLNEIYGWFARNAAVVGNALRDEEFDRLIGEVNALRIGPPMASYQDVLGQGLTAKQRAMLALALSFHTWRTLTRDAGMTQQDAAAAMADAVTV